MTDTDLRTAAAAAGEFRLPGDILSIERIPPGFSGAELFRCQTAGGDFAIKRWPTQTKPERIDEVHAVQRLAANQLAFVPRLIATHSGSTRLTIRNESFEIATWMRGNPLDENDAPREKIARGAAAIAQFHVATATAGLTTNAGLTKAIPPAVTSRIDRLNELADLMPQALAIDFQEHDGISQIQARLRQDWRSMHQAAKRTISSWANVAMPLRCVIRDCHRGHILFEADRVTGMVDFDAIKRDTVATDLARWVGTIGFESEGDLAQHWLAAVDGYRSVNPLTEDEVRLARELESVNHVIVLANWVVWVVLEQRRFCETIEKTNHRLTQLLRRIARRY